MRVRVRVFPRREVLDPQGRAIREALLRVGFEDVGDVRAGKSFDLEVSAADAEAALAEGEEMCRRLLANPVVEEFEIELAEEGDEDEAGDLG